MLKNNKEREEFIKDKLNWKRVFVDHETGIYASKIELKNGSILYDVKEFSEFYGQYRHQKYMLKTKTTFDRSMTLNEVIRYLTNHKNEI